MFGDHEEYKGTRVTTIHYCGECQKDFLDKEICYYTWYENDVFCIDCKEIMNGRVDQSYLDWQRRIFKK